MEKLVSLPLLQWMSLCIVVQMCRCRAGRIKNVLLSNSVVAALEMCLCSNSAAFKDWVSY